ncbi:MAG TPA: 4-hydroxy-3-methylbut-2-enyl diphosphate reductase [Acidimicrobiales bacterium]|nr:4-hydroxy-3-methylbut-2-enyl diphosphate reductase [Acidimicrobiales bacterium]
MADVGGVRDVVDLRDVPEVHDLRGRRVLLAAPRSFCAGVERAIDIVERALARYGAPVYVRRQIVHNTHVVRDLEEKGAVFVEELDEVPDGAVTVLAAHGVTPSVRADAGSRGLRTIDATCPLVAKVHHEARRWADLGYSIVLVGHPEHEEVVGTLGEAPDAIHIVEDVVDVRDLPIPDGAQVAFLTQTTLATDETAAIVDELRRRYPELAGPRADDICYATQNRQDAVRALAPECDVILVVGSRNSSNSNRLVEVAERAGCPAYLIEDETELQPGWLDGATVVGVTAGASAPESLVTRVVSALAPASVEERHVVHEHVRFTLPQEVR